MNMKGPSVLGFELWSGHSIFAYDENKKINISTSSVCHVGYASLFMQEEGRQ